MEAYMKSGEGSNSKNSVRILGVRVDKINKLSALKKIEDLFKFEQKSYIVTPNPEIILKAFYHQEYKKILNESQIALADGAGLLWAASFLNKGIGFSKAKYANIPVFFVSFLFSWFKFFLSKKYRTAVIPERLCGSDVFFNLIKFAEQNNCSVYLLGAREGIAQKVAENLRKKYPKIRIVGTYCGSSEVNDDHKLRYLINDSKASFLFVAYGAPKQEYWIKRNLAFLKYIKIAMTVGGTFDFIANKSRRAPKIYQKLNLEWFWRLKTEPWRKKRIINAVFKFPWSVFLDKIYQFRPYRPNVLGVIVNTNNEFLLLNNSYISRHEKEQEHWQFLQGGTEKNETPQNAVLRESFEEMGSKKLNIIEQSEIVYQYNWKPKTLNLKRPFRGQRQTIWYLRYTGDGQDIKISPKEHSDFKWVKKEKVLRYLHPIRHECGKMILEEIEKKHILDKIS